MPDQSSKLPDNPRNIIHRTVLQIRLIWRLFWDKRVSPLLKLVPFAGLAYLIFPLDFVPDFLVGLGQLDDLSILFGSIWLFVEICPPNVVQEHWRELTSVVPGVWREADADENGSATPEILPPKE